MTNGGKESREVIEFLKYFEELKEIIDDQPHGLTELADHDEGVMEICRDLYRCGIRLSLSERAHRELHAAPVDPRFIESWREYEKRYQAVLANVVSDPIFRGAEGPIGPDAAFLPSDWEKADGAAEDAALGITEAIDFAYYNISQSERWDDDQQGFVYRVEKGVFAWEGLNKTVGLDLQGIFRRRALVPFVLVPRAVSAKHGSAERISLLRNLQQAQEAFIFGVPFAALALMRSVMERVLRDHYVADEGDLSRLIYLAERRLPSGVTKETLHRLRKTANLILHLPSENANGENNKILDQIDSKKFENEIIFFLLVLRALIEGVE